MLSCGSTKNEETTFGSYGLDSETEIIYKAFYRMEMDHGNDRPRRYMFAFTSDKDFELGKSLYPESIITIDLFEEQYFGKEISLDDPEIVLRLYLRFELTVKNKRYYYYGTSQEGPIELSAGIVDDLTDETTALEVKGGSLKITKEGDKFDVYINALLGDHTITCSYSGAPVFLSEVI